MSSEEGRLLELEEFFKSLATLFSKILILFSREPMVSQIRYVMIVSIPDTITHQEAERKLFLPKNYGEILNLKVKAIIARERLPDI